MSNLYGTDEWRSLDEISRAQLLLVIEGLKKGTIIGGNWTSFLNVLKETGLDYQLNTNRYQLNPVMRVARPEELQKLNYEPLILPNDANGKDYHRIMGDFLSYPKCCTEEYVSDSVPEERQARREGKLHLTYKFGRELTDLIEKENKYPDVFDYRPPSFTPCGIGCEDSIKLLSGWKNAVETNDPKAGYEIVLFNRGSYPERLAHKAFIEKEYGRIRLEHKLSYLQRSIK